MLAKLLLPAVLLAIAGAASAQTSTTTTTTAPATKTTSKSTAPALTAEQKAALVKMNQLAAQNAQRVATMVDQGKAGDVWDTSSSTAKQAVTRDAFVKATTADRAKLGNVTSRKVVRVTHTFSKGDAKLPAGAYTNVVFATQFSNNKQPVRELVSFHLDNDKQWRVSGYTVH
ncbi:MAG: DUF4019 domain-containing protein [Rhodanobacteraceae bacterium]|nr:DUF4019 domain-containing protein [Pseudomonadota bacterium]